MRVLIGILLIIVAVAFLLFSIVPAVTDSDFVMGVLEPLYCDGGDQLSAERTVSSCSDGGTCYSAIYTCMRRNETTYDVTGKSWVITAIGFTVPLLLGIIVINIAARSGASRIQSQLTQAFGTNSTNWTSGMSTGTPQVFGVSSISASPSQPDLKAKLQQLKDAYDQNLITQDEYDRKRDEIMNQF